MIREHRPGAVGRSDAAPPYRPSAVARKAGADIVAPLCNGPDSSVGQPAAAYSFPPRGRGLGRLILSGVGAAAGGDRVVAVRPGEAAARARLPAGRLLAGRPRAAPVLDRLGSASSAAQGRYVCDPVERASPTRSCGCSSSWPRGGASCASIRSCSRAAAGGRASPRRPALGAAGRGAPQRSARRQLHVKPGATLAASQTVRLAARWSR
jgi:hypothetical protein